MLKTPQERLAEALAGVDAKYARRRRLAAAAGAAAWIVVVLVVGLFGGCPHPPPGPVTPPDASDAAAASCDEACANIARLGCGGADACPSVCPKILDPAYRACAAAARNCPTVDACGRR